MDFSNKNIKRIYENSRSMLLASAFVYAFCAMWGLKVPALVILTISILAIGLLNLFGSKKNNVFFYVLPVVILTFLILLCVLLKIDVILHLKRIVQWAINFFGRGGEYNALYAYIFASAFVILIGIITYCIDKIRAARVFIAIGLFVSAIILCISKLEIPKFSVAIGLFYIFNILIENVHVFDKKSIKVKDTEKSALYLMPICMIAAIIAVSLPSKTTPIQWITVRNSISALSNQMEILIDKIELLFFSGDSEFFINIVGYSDNSQKIGGKILSDDDTILYLKTQDKTKADLYLTGSIRNEYTGDRWKSTAPKNNEKSDEYILDFYELLSAFERDGVSEGELDELITKENSVVVYDQIQTKTLFYPLKSYSITSKYNNKGINTSDENIVFNRIKGKGTSYQLKFVDVNYDGDRFKEIASKQDGFSYNGKHYFADNFKNYINSYLNIKSINYDVNDLNSIFAKRAKEIKENYLALPKSMPNRVKELSLELTKNYNSSYDKLKALESYLNTYKYTTEPTKTPKGMDLVDYFLFEQKEGYCTYFASSMAVMGRCIGIPTRYVEGVTLNYENTLPDAAYAVTDNEVHAWAEAYIEGIGWIPFEPTSGDYSDRYSEWDSGILGNADGYVSPYQTPDMSGNLPGLDDFENSQKAGNSHLIPILLTSLYAILFIAVVFAVYYIIVRLRYKSRLNKSDRHERVYLLFTEMFFDLKKLGYELKPQETILVFADRIRGRFIFDNKLTFMTAAELFMKVRYAEKELSDQEFEQVISIKKNIENELQIKIGKFRMFFLKFLLYCK